MNKQMALVAAALAVAPAALAPAKAQEQQIRCAPAGTIVERTNGPRLVFRGQESGNPLVCINEGGQRRLLGYWGVQENFFRNGQAQLARLFNPGPDSSTRTQTINYFGTDRYGLGNTVTETWRIAGSGPLEVPAGRFETIRVVRDFQVVGSTYRYVQNVWLDKATGAPVKANVEHLNAVMSPTLTSWEATEVRAGAVQANR